jgi:hypothetical protein
MIDEYSKLDKSDQQYMLGQIMKAEIIQGLVSRIICLTQTRDGKKDADLKGIFRLGKEMTAEERRGLGGYSSGVSIGVPSAALGNCNVGPDAQTCLV